MTVTECPTCGWPASDVYEVISRHITSDGVVTYSRCACGALQLLFQPYGPPQVLRSQP